MTCALCPRPAKYRGQGTKSYCECHKHIADQSSKLFSKRYEQRGDAYSAEQYARRLESSRRYEQNTRPKLRPGRPVLRKWDPLIDTIA